MTAKIEFNKERVAVIKNQFKPPYDSNAVIAAISATESLPMGREVSHGQ